MTNALSNTEKLFKNMTVYIFKTSLGANRFYKPAIMSFVNNFDSNQNFIFRCSSQSFKIKSLSEEDRNYFQEWAERYLFDLYFFKQFCDEPNIEHYLKGLKQEISNELSYIENNHNEALSMTALSNIFNRNQFKEIEKKLLQRIKDEGLVVF